MSILAKFVGSHSHPTGRSRIGTSGDNPSLSGVCFGAPKLPPKTCPFIIRLLSLPNELQTEILCNLRIEAVFSLRLACRELYFLTESHQTSLVRNLWPSKLRSDPQPCGCNQPSTIHGILWSPEKVTLNDYYQLSHRCLMVTHLTNLLGLSVGKRVLGVSRNELGLFHPFSTSFWRPIFPLMHISLWLVEYREKLVEAVNCEQHINHEALESSLFDGFSSPCLLRSWGIFRIIIMVLKV